MPGCQQSLVRPALGRLCKALGKKLIAPRPTRRRDLLASMNSDSFLANSHRCHLWQKHADNRRVRRVGGHRFSAAHVCFWLKADVGALANHFSAFFLFLVPCASIVIT